MVQLNDYESNIIKCYVGGKVPEVPIYTIRLCLRPSLATFVALLALCKNRKQLFAFNIACGYDVSQSFMG